MGSLCDRIGRRRLLLLDAARAAFTHGLAAAALGAAATMILAAILTAVFLRGTQPESPPAAGQPAEALPER